MHRPLQGRIALVAGATRGAGRGIAVELGAAGAVVYCTGRSTRLRRSDYDRPETIEDSAELVTAAGGEGVAVEVDHLEPEQVQRLLARVEQQRGRLDVLVNDLGGEHLTEFGPPLWERSLSRELRRLHTGIDAHLITSHFALRLLSRTPGGLVVELTDGTAEENANYRAEAGVSYDLTKIAASRLALAQAQELRPHGGTAVAVTPGFLRSELMLDAFGVTEDNWREADVPHFGMSETPRYVGRGVAALAADPDVARFAGTTLSSGFLAREYGLTDVDGSRPDWARYMTEVVRAGLPEDTTGYR